ncbi:MAG: UDP-3-O-(3-hydroxymyristoyl)glucosamine N-acyltransferase [Pseudomonadota bacterium]
MSHLAQQLCEQFSHLVEDSRNTDTRFNRIDAANDYRSDSLIFVENQEKLFSDEAARPAVLVTTTDIAAQLENEDLCVLTVQDVRMAQALIKQAYQDYDPSDPEWDAIHPSAVVHPSVTLGENVRIGANSVIGQDTKIGNNVQIRANCVIEHTVEIGDDCIINNLVNIGYGCRLGKRVILRPGVIVGNEGFGFAQDKDRHYHRLPHTGIVEIHDDVQIGSNCNIDRATYGKTIIGSGVKVDALCHIAHNVHIDEKSLFVAQTGIAGSSYIGKRVICSGQTGILDHRTVADDAVLLHRCGVTEDVPSAGMWAGTPVKPFREYVRGLTLGKRLDKLERKVKSLSGKD